MQETAHQIEAVHPQPPAHHPFPTTSLIKSLAAKRHNRRELRVYRPIPSEGAEGEAFHISVHARDFSDV